MDSHCNIVLIGMLLAQRTCQHIITTLGNNFPVKLQSAV